MFSYFVAELTSNRVKMFSFKKRAEISDNFRKEITRFHGVAKSIFNKCGSLSKLKGSTKLIAPQPN